MGKVIHISKQVQTPIQVKLTEMFDKMMLRRLKKTKNKKDAVNYSGKY